MPWAWLGKSFLAESGRAAHDCQRRRRRLAFARSIFPEHQIQEFRNSGYRTTALVGTNVTKEDMRSRLPDQDIILWEGHHSTLVRDFAVQSSPEPLRPALIILQSCLALNKADASPLLHRGGIGLIGSSTPRVFPASGGAFTLAFFDAMMYGRQTVGGSLRHAKNFLLAYSLLKEKRLGARAKLKAANVDPRPGPSRSGAIRPSACRPQESPTMRWPPWSITSAATPSFCKCPRPTSPKRSRRSIRPRLSRMVGSAAW